MASPMKSGPGGRRAADPQYVPVNTAETSPDPSSLAHDSRSSGYLSPEPHDAMLRRDSDLYPAPSLLSRDSTHTSLPGTPALNRDSWGSGVALAAGAGAISGAQLPPRESSRLAHSSLGWNNTTNDEDDGQGHITPAPVSEKPRWSEPPRKSRKWLWIGLGAGIVLILAGVGAGVGIALTRNKGNSNGNSNSGNADPGSPSSAATSGSPTSTGTAPTPSVTSGGQGTLLTFADGTTMTYANSFGGTWVSDPSNPFNNEAQAQSYTPPLNQNWTWGQDTIYGVNLGGWLVTEPFIVSSLYETYATGPAGTAVDEYTLSLNMGSNLTAAMTEHYETFITERDIAEIATAGLNWVRIPIGHWAVATIPGEPYLQGVSWQYFLKAVQWCRKYGIRIKLDLHTAPGSQNGWNHSGRLGTINWMNGVMGIANAQRSLDVMRSFAQFISQPEYLPVIPLFGFLNEPNGISLDQSTIGSFYAEAYQMLREVTGTGAGNGPLLSMHDGFRGTAAWAGFLPGADRLGLDQHPYMAFQNQQTGPLSSIVTIPCQWWASGTNTSSNAFGVTISGEFSIAINDCGYWVNNVGQGSRYDGTYSGYTGPTGGPGACAQWNNWQSWSASTKAGLMEVAQGSMDALQNWFFWTWKIGNSTIQSPPEVNPFWHYRLGWMNGWLPTDPRTAAGTCVSQGISPVPFDGTYQPYMTGGAGAGVVPTAAYASYPWPAASFTAIPAGQMGLLPQYTPTATPVTLPGPTFTSPSGATINAGNGWANPNDMSRGAFTAIAGCAYPPEYSAANLSPTAGACGAGLAQNVLKRGPEPTAPAA